MRRVVCLLLVFLFAAEAWSQGFGIPSKRGGIGFGNLPRFTGIRFNFIDRNVERLYGINVTVWNAKDESQQTGSMSGISIGLPIAMGLENQSGVSVGIFGTGAKKNLSGVNIGGLGVGAGGSVRGLNLGGLGIGAGGDVSGFSVALLGVGSGGKVSGFSFGGLGVGSGGGMSGINIGGLGVGSGGDLTGLNIGGLGVGSGQDVTGINLSVGAVGAGARVRGFNLAGLALGSGEALQGISIAGLAAGSPKVGGLTVAAVVGGLKVTGITIAPLWLRVGGDKPTKKDKSDSTRFDAGTFENDQRVGEGELTGFSVSAYHRVLGMQKGMAVGIVNYTQDIRGVQFGLINIVRDNPKGLRVLPFFNTRFGKKRE
jgi:hypothetical protein